MKNVKKHKKWWIAVMLAVILIAFLAIMSEGLTGYATYQLQYDLEDYPEPFVRGGMYNQVYVVVPDTYTDLELDVAKKISSGMKGVQPSFSRILQESELPQGDYNLIFVGMPCEMLSMELLLGTDECTYGEDGYLKELKVGRRSYILVTGRDEVGIMKAGLALANHHVYDLKGSEINVKGSLDSPIGLVLEYI